MAKVQILTLIFVSVVFALSLAHALELPGKMRLNQEAYYAVQPIYYPGFTIGGLSERASIVLTVILLFLTPTRSVDFWLTLVALIGLVGLQMVYWFFTHPVNQFWVAGEKLTRLGSGFFSFGTKQNKARPPEWTALRNRWEYSHVARAGLAFISFVALILALK
jgi:hypothetical protein